MTIGYNPRYALAADVVEYNPARDHADKRTAMVAAKLLKELASLLLHSSAAMAARA